MLEDRLMKSEICAINSKVLMDYVENKLGADKIKDLFEGVLEPDTLESKVFSFKDRQGNAKKIDLDFFKDEDNFYSNEVSLKLFKNLSNMGIDLYDVGKYGADNSERLTESVRDAARLFGPTKTIKRANKINKKFNRTKVIEVYDETKISAKARMIYKPNVQVEPEVCRYNLGWYVGLLEKVGFRDVTAEEIECKTKGDYYCTFHLKWKPEKLKDRVKLFLGKKIADRFAETYKEDVQMLIEKLSQERDDRNELIATLERRVEERTKEARDLLKRIAPPEDVDDMIRKSFDPQVVNATTLFADVCGFTEFSTGKTPHQISDKINQLFNRMHNIIEPHRGYEVKYNGDNIMAVFGAAFRNEAHPTDAVLCAMKMIEQENEFDMRIGINTGDIVKLTLGAQDNLRWDIMGETVNIAQRMEKHGKKGVVTVSEHTKELVENYFKIKRSRDKVKIKGYTEPQFLYYVDRLRKVSECRDRVSSNVKHFESLEMDVDKFCREELKGYDFTQYDSKEGDPLRSKSVALFSYAIAKAMDGGVDYSRLLKASFLSEIGKTKIQQGALNRPYMNKANIIEEIRIKTIESVSEDLRPLLNDFYGERAGVDAQVIKAAQIYTAQKCSKIYQKYKPMDIAHELGRQNIGKDVMGAMASLGMMK